ncbi:MAG: hypothetical protein MUD15_00740, partial [Desulfobacterota bacterium]|nr:hypothetical protein [Thermodesulfobacteriota bacterium]
MKKGILAVLFVLCATAVYAGSYDPTMSCPTEATTRAERERGYEVCGKPYVSFDLSGEFSAEGLYWDNYALLSDDTVTNSFYRGYVSLFPKISVGDTSIIMKVNMRDETWGDKAAYGTDDPDVWSYKYSTSSTAANDNINIERAYLSHKFATDTTLDVGLMSGGWWATKFGDRQEPRYRVKVVQKTKVGVIGALVEKDAELGSPTVEDSEKDDYDSYAVFGVTKAGTVFIKPLIFYVDRSSSVPLADKEGIQNLYITVGLDGTLGPLGFEGEFSYRDTKFKDLSALAPIPNPANPLQPLFALADDATTYGAYMDLWMPMDFGRPGIVLTYCSWDEEGGPVGSGYGLDNRTDFESNVILGDEIGFGSAPWQGAEDLLGMTMVKPYINNVKLMDKLTCDASFAYIMSNQDAYTATLAGAVGPNRFEDATAWEIDLGVNYRISDNLTYMVDAGYASISYDVTGFDD